MFVRRRPLLRAAVVGGGAYVVGKRRGEQSAMDQDEQHGQQTQPEEQGGQPSVSDQLAQLSSLHAQGSLSDAEFAAAKARLLGS
ncbi:MAG TPA: SHOCT domain-containing protein [Streptosporangiaceae bacterium]|nr:SHOCT domain-containing protein [Streptosporangiaceae bacterium]